MLLCRRIPPIGIQLECRSANCLHSRNVLNFPEDSFFSLGIVCQIGSLFIRRLCLERAHLYMFQKWPIPYFQPSHQPIFLCIAYRQTDRQTKVNSALHFILKQSFFKKVFKNMLPLQEVPLNYVWNLNTCFSESMQKQFFFCHVHSLTNLWFHQWLWNGFLQLFLVLTFYSFTRIQLFVQRVRGFLPFSFYFFHSSLLPLPCVPLL